MAQDYYAIDDVLAEFDPTESVAFLHGSLIARLVCGERLTQSDWLDSICSLLEIESAFDEEQAHLLNEFYDQALSDLNASPEGVAPLTPVNAPLADRLDALADWCAAFVSTLGMVGKLQAPDEDDQTLLSDLIAISQLDSDSASEEDAEDDYQALRAHAQLATRHFFERFAPPSSDTPLH